MQCPRCEGSGQCPDCQGKGSVPCLSCEGSGQRISSRGQSYPCKTCRGSGQAECSPLCSSCEGSGQITTELQNKVRGKYEVRFDNTLPKTRVTYAICSLLVVVYLIGLASPAVSEWLDTYCSNISGLWKEPWRLFTSIFLHAGLLHLLFNVLTLRTIGPWLEGFYGSRRFTLLFLLAGVGGAALSSGAHQALGQPSFSLGASGALCGLTGAVAGAHARYRSFSHEQVWGLLTWMAIYSGAAWFWASNIDHWAHLGGLLTGFAYAWLSRRPTGQ